MESSEREGAMGRGGYHLLTPQGILKGLFRDTPHGAPQSPSLLGTDPTRKTPDSGSSESAGELVNGKV